jgi:hypothetical protein
MGEVRVRVCLFLSYPVMHTYRFLTCLVLSRLSLSCLVLSCLVLSGLVSCLALVVCLFLFCFILSSPASYTTKLR